MFRGYWSKYAKIAGLGALIAIGSLFTYAATIPHGLVLKQEAANKAHIERDNAEYAIKWVCSSPSAEKDCVAKTRQTQNENTRNAEDLGAQKLSAWWAQVMAVAALIGMGLSAVGVWLVKTTFDEARKSNRIAIRNAMMAYGADVYIVSANVKIANNEFIVSLNLKNASNYRANKVQIKINAEIIEITSDSRSFNYNSSREHGWLNESEITSFNGNVQVDNFRLEFIHQNFPDITFSEIVEKVTKIIPTIVRINGYIKWSNNFGNDDMTNIEFSFFSFKKGGRVKAQRFVEASAVNIEHSKIWPT